MIRHKSAIVPSGPWEAINCTDFCAEVGRVAISRYKWSCGPNIDENLSVTLGPHCLMYLKQPKRGENGANEAYVRYVRYACFCLIPRVFGGGFTLGTFRARDLSGSV